MKFAIKNAPHLKLKKWIRETAEGIDLPAPESIIILVKKTINIKD